MSFAVATHIPLGIKVKAGDLIWLRSWCLVSLAPSEKVRGCCSPIAARGCVPVTLMPNKHKRQPSEVVINKNVNWLNNPAVWAWYIGLVLLSYFVLCAVIQDAGLAWTYVHLIHGVVTYYLLHWLKGTPFADDDQGQYYRLTFWEQLDNGVYATYKRKLFTAIPVVLFLLATNGTDFRKQPLALNLAVVLVCVIAKLPALHKVRIMGINKY